MRLLAMASTVPLLATLAVAPPAPEAEWLRAVRAEIDARAADDRFSGVVLLARGQTVLLQEARGFADAERRSPLTPETGFNLGSMNKMFTGLAIVQLAQAGKLRFGDTVGQHLPDYPNPDAARVTIEQLLTHTGGLATSSARNTRRGTTRSSR